MKIKFILLVLSIFFIGSLSIAQISINQSDYASIFKIGNSFNNFGDTLTTSVDIGNTGGENNWDFSGFVANVSFVNNYISPSGTPFESTFPSAGLVSHFIITDDSSGGTSETWNYISSSDGAIIGSGIINTVTNGSSVDSSISITTHYPPFLEFDFPIVANKSWDIKDSTETTIITTQGSFTNNISTVYNISVDAWGTMKLPSGNSYEALRLREESTTTTYFAGIPLFSSTTVDYLFLSKTGESFSVSTESANPPASGEVSGTVGWSENSITSIEKTDELPNEFSLHQNYPNPFNPSTTIKFSVPESGLVRLDVYNMIGELVTTLINKKMDAGFQSIQFNASNLASGIYLYRLSTKSFSKVKKMMLLK